MTESSSQKREEFFKSSSASWLSRMGQVSQFVCAFKERACLITFITMTQTRLKLMEFLFRFDVETECEKFDKNVKNEPPAKINNSGLKIKTQVDAACIVYFIMRLIFTFQHL